MNKTLAIAILVATPLTATSAASPVDNYGATAIQRADYARAELSLSNRVAAVPADEAALLNLAHVYRRTARMAQAQALYTRVLALPDVLLADTSDRPRSSHALARASLTRVSLSAR